MINTNIFNYVNVIFIMPYPLKAFRELHKTQISNKMENTFHNHNNIKINSCFASSVEFRRYVNGIHIKMHF